MNSNDEDLNTENKIIDNISNVILSDGVTHQVIEIGSYNSNTSSNNNNNNNDTDNLIIKSSSKESISHYDADDEYESNLEEEEEDDDSDMDPYSQRKKNLKHLEKLDRIQKEKKAFRDRVVYILMADFILCIVFIPIVYAFYYLPSLKLGDSEFFRYWYYNFQFSKYLIWITTISIGFSYVSLITESRSFPFHCRYNRSRDFFQLLFAASLLYLIGPSRTLMGKDDLIHHSTSSSFLFNYFSFSIPYILGLHYTYLDKIELLQLAGDRFSSPSLWKSYRFKELIIIIPVILGILILVIYHCYLLVIDHLWEYFMVAYGLFFMTLFGITWFLRKSHYLHMHHYFIFGSLIPFSAFQTALSAISLGLLSGIMTEGVSRWSMGWFWYKGERTL